METEKIAREVNYLIIQNLDAEEAYTEAAVNTENKALKNALLDEAEKRSGYARELQREVKDLGEEIADEISMKAIWNSAWAKIKRLFANRNNASIIEECKKHDDETILAYDTILELGDGFLPSRIYNIIKRQRKELGLTYQALLKFHDQVVKV